MKVDRLLYIILIAIISNQLIAQIESGSPLPILVVDAFGQDVPDEPKIDADIFIYYDSTATLNFISEEYLHYDGFSGIEKRGQSSLMLFPKNGYGIETRNEDGSNNNVSIFGWPKENDWVLHGPYSDKTLIRNALAYKLAGQVMAYAPRTQFCELIVNGSYEGVYLFTEKIKRDNGRVDISKLRPEDNEGDQLTGGYIVKFDKGSDIEFGWQSMFQPLEGTFQQTSFFMVEPKAWQLSDTQLDYIQGTFDDFETDLMSDNFKDSLEGYRQHIDVDNFINFMLHQELTGNVDSYRLSTYMYKDRDSIDSHIKMGPVWDYNLAFGNVNYCNGGPVSGWRWDFNSVCPQDFWLNHVWWRRFLQDTYFTELLKSTWKSHRETIWSDQQVIACIDSLTIEVSPAADRNFERWPVIGQWVWPNNVVGESYAAEIENLKEWTLARMEWIDNNIESFLTEAELQILDPGLEIFPNPNSGTFAMNWNRQKFAPVSLRVFDGSGLLVFEQSDFTSQMYSRTIETNLVPGMYYYLFEGVQGVVNGQFIVAN